MGCDETQALLFAQHMYNTCNPNTQVYVQFHLMSLVNRPPCLLLRNPNKGSAVCVCVLR